MDEKILIQSYLSSDALIVTSLADGMNLVSYEYLACQREENPGILCLSTRAGSAQYLDSALQFDPTSIDAIQQCFHDAQSLSLKKRQKRLQISLAYMKQYTVSEWRQSLVETYQTNKSSEKIFT